MTNSQRLALELRQTNHDYNELIGVINAMPDTESPSTEQQTKLTELRAKASGTETRIEAAKVTEQREEALAAAEEPLDAESRDLDRLLGAASVGAVMQAVTEQRNTAGAERELQEHFHLAGNQVPLDLLVGRGGVTEKRTTGVTPAPTVVGQSQRPIIPAVFPRAAVSFLGIAQDRVPVGEAVYTVVSTSASPGTPAEGTDQAHSTGALTASSLSPGRIQASLFYSREDAARLQGMDAALRRNLGDALADKLDEEVIDDLLTGSRLGNNNASTEDDFDSYRKRFLYDRIDGTWATEASDIRVLMGATSYGHAAAAYRAAANADNGLGALRAESGGVRVTAHAPTVSGNKQNCLIRRGSRMDYAIGLWQGVTVLVDPYSLSKSGEIILTAVLLFAHKLLRADGFAKVQSQHA